MVGYCEDNNDTADSIHSAACLHYLGLYLIQYRDSTPVRLRAVTQLGFCGSRWPIVKMAALTEVGKF
jgi:hypothetical protein